MAYYEHPSYQKADLEPQVHSTPLEYGGQATPLHYGDGVQTSPYEQATPLKYDGSYRGSQYGQQHKPQQATPLRYDAPGEYDTHYRPDPSNLPPQTQVDLDDRKLPNYKPTPLKWSFLIVIIVVIMAFLAMLEYATNKLPHSEDREVIESIGETSGLKVRELRPGATLVPRAAATAATILPTPTPLWILHGNQVKRAPQTGTPAPDHFADLDNTISVGPTPTPSPEPEPEPNPDDIEIVVGDGDCKFCTRLPDEHAPDGETTIEVPEEIQIPTVIDGSSTTLKSTSIMNIVSTIAHKPTAAPTPTFVTAEVTTSTNSDGRVTVVTSTPKPVSTPTVVTTTDSLGRATVVSTSVLATPSTTLLTDAAGVVTATQVFYPSVPTPETSEPTVLVFRMRKRDYLVGYFLPTILAILLSIPVRMIDLNAKLYYPFHELTRHEGATAYDSLLLRTGGIYGLMTSVRALAGGKLLLFLTTLLVTCSALLIPLSSEAISLKLYNVNGKCHSLDFRGCTMNLAVFPIPAHATAALLAFMIVIICLIMLSLRRWRSGVANNPWSIAGIAALTTNVNTRLLVSSLPRGTSQIRYRKLVQHLEDRTFRLGWFLNPHGVPEYGIIIQNESAMPLQYPSSEVEDIMVGGASEKSTKGRRIRHQLPFLMLSFSGRAGFSLFLCGLLAVILYYNNSGGDTPFELFMDSQRFGVRFLFTSFGVIITFFWTSFFTGIAMLNPYQALAAGPKTPSRSILLSPPTNPFSGLVSAIRRRNIFLIIVALTAIFSEFLPILLNNVPYRVTQTWMTHLVCTWMAVAILCIMLLVVLGSFFVRWPHLPVDPTTVAGAMYYVADSKMVWNFGGLGVASRKERDARVNDMGGMYEFGYIDGVSGVRRIGVDVMDGYGQRP